VLVKQINHVNFIDNSTLGPPRSTIITHSSLRAVVRRRTYHVISVSSSFPALLDTSPDSIAAVAHFIAKAQDTKNKVSCSPVLVEYASEKK
jgi:hypothetical protein